MRGLGAKEAAMGCCRMTHPPMPDQHQLGAGPELSGQLESLPKAGVQNTSPQIQGESVATSTGPLSCQKAEVIGGEGLQG